MKLQTNGEKIKRAIESVMSQDSLKYCCNEFWFTVEEFDEFLDLGVEAFDGMNGIVISEPHWIMFDRDYWSDCYTIMEQIWATDDGVPRAKSFRITPNTVTVSSASSDGDYEEHVYRMDRIES